MHNILIFLANAIKYNYTERSLHLFVKTFLLLISYEFNNKVECKLEMILIENNEIKYDNIENDLILDELICNSEIARDKTILDCVLLNKSGQTTV